MRFIILAALLVPLQEPPDADVLIQGATIADGTGREAWIGDIAIRGEKIVAIGKKLDVKARRTIDARGLVVAPGFIDLHTHSDDTAIAKEGRKNFSYLTQGVTTMVTGNCGGGKSDVKNYFAKIEEQGCGSNIIHLIPHGDIRRKVIGDVDRAPSDAELAKMKDLIETEMKNGAWGMSTGLIYVPGTYAKTDELIELSKVVAKHGGFYATHMRNEGDHLIDSIKEALEIGEKAEIRVHISHLKAAGRANWGKVKEACALIAEARSKGKRVTADQYPYTASSTSLAAMVIPTWAREGGQKKLVERLDDPETGKKVRDAVGKSLHERGEGSTVRIANFAKKKEWNGKSIAEIAKAEGRDPVDIVVEIEKGGGAQAISFGMSEEDVEFVMKQEFVATASDGAAKLPGDTMPHPRSYGTFPRKIGLYGIEKKLISLEFAVRASSGLPAEILGLKDRGLLKEGYFADVVLFDPDSFRDKSTYDKPHQLSTGMKYVWISGVAALEDGKPTDALPGRPLRR